jgi:hypothetical protein
MKHTPGPWKVERITATEKKTLIYCRINSITSHWTLGFAGVYKGHTVEETEANARLLAAAPTMLEALQDLTALYAASPGHDPNFVEKGLAAIRKATGG